jgi:hypothetical protein
MTVLISDAKAAIGATSPALRELVYADDTLIVAARAEDAQEYMQAIAAAGANYGLKYNWKKLEALPIRCQACIAKPDGTEIAQKDSIVYLGAVLCADGSIGPELSRRIGAARRDFDTLARVWSHSALTSLEKIRIFEVCVVSKLTYCLHTAWMKKPEMDRLDAFQARCLRRILGIPHSYVSHVSNATVLHTAGARKMSFTLLQRQTSIWRMWDVRATMILFDV